jgi:cell division septation protein DedD
VPELSHDTTEDGFHEIQLSGKQLVFLFIVTTSVVVGVFLFGVLVGRGARDARQDEAPAATSSAAAAPAPAAAADPPATEAPAPAGDGPEKPDELSYADRLTKSSPATETLKPKAEDKPKAEEPRMPPPAAAAPSTASAPPKEPVVKPQAAAPATSPAAPTGASSVPTAGKPGTWLVQVIATREPAVANSVVKRLASKGYPAFLVNPVPGAPQPFYKVQVGRYGERSEAEQVSQRIKKEEQFQSWILR